MAPSTSPLAPQDLLKEAMAQAMAEALEDERLDDGTIEVDSDEEYQ